MKIIISFLLIYASLLAKPLLDDEKLILVYVEMEHCQWCHKMNRETLDNPTYLTQLQKEYHIAKIVKESGDIPLFLHPQYYPTTYILSSDGKQILDELPGYMQSTRYLSYLHQLFEVETQKE